MKKKTVRNLFVFIILLTILLCIIFSLSRKKNSTEVDVDTEYGTISASTTNTEEKSVETVPEEEVTEYISKLNDAHHTFYDTCDYKFAIEDYGTNVEIDPSLSALVEPCIVDGKDVNLVFYSIVNALAQNFGGNSNDYAFQQTSYVENSDIVLFQFVNKITNNLYDVTYDDNFIYCNDGSEIAE